MQLMVRYLFLAGILFLGVVSETSWLSWRHLAFR